jgi:hypothetical protein
LNSGVASSGLALNSGVASSGLALSGEMHAEVALTKCRATTAEAQARRQANQFKGMRWPLQCMHQAITKNKKPADQGGFGAKRTAPGAQVGGGPSPGFPNQQLISPLQPAQPGPGSAPPAEYCSTEGIGPRKGRAEEPPPFLPLPHSPARASCVLAPWWLVGSSHAPKPKP